MRNEYYLIGLGLETGIELSEEVANRLIAKGLLVLDGTEILKSIDVKFYWLKIAI
ncbi:hypothetical protein SAMN05444362_102336 [Dysgonomonas macrotermitis]|uniref:Uncharacterized protein n=1 Tax=Dysgonomonas macrotermitis TaxID=1346286 RepID=A0A1M4WWV2_9BACT|nr:hypothetical protein SAMN05444362_102336 [Dysgonomonas macrotermitis]